MLFSTSLTQSNTCIRRIIRPFYHNSVFPTIILYKLQIILVLMVYVKRTVLINIKYFDNNIKDSYLSVLEIKSILLKPYDSCMVVTFTDEKESNPKPVWCRGRSPPGTSYIQTIDEFAVNAARPYVFQGSRKKGI